MIASRHLEGRSRYERVTEGWVDNSHADAFTHTVRLADDDAAVEVSAVCTPSPAYQVRSAHARVLSGTGAPDVAAAFGDLAGARMVTGFGRRLAEVCGAEDGAGLFVEGGIEIARLARQVAKLPAEAVAGFRSGDASACWDLDTKGWSDLPGSCFTYSAGGRALLGTRPASTPMTRSLYDPAPGAVKVFHRKRLVRLVLTGDRLHLFHAMHDNVHGFDVHLEVDLESERIVAADSVTSRLPYPGICSEPQVKIASLIGEPANGALRKRIQTVVGGEGGCAQLYDLTSDLLKLLSFS